MPAIIFFDVDNTLWDHHMVIPQSTKDAIRKLHDKGHLSIVCTGRARGNLEAGELLTLPFDGIIAACGTHVEFGGKMLYERLLEDEVLKTCIRVCAEAKLPLVLEGPKDHWIDEDGFGNDPYVTYLYDTMGDAVHPLRGYERGMEVNKISSLVMPQSDFKVVVNALKDLVTIIKHPNPVVEIMPKGSSKSTGIRFLCDYLKIPVEEAYAVGDSANDLDMLHLVGHGIAMGNGTKEVKETAEYVTADINEDGLYLAMQHYGLID